MKAAFLMMSVLLAQFLRLLIAPCCVLLRLLASYCASLCLIAGAAGEPAVPGAGPRRVPGGHAFPRRQGRPARRHDPGQVP